MLGPTMLYLKGMRIMMFQLSGIYCTPIMELGTERPSLSRLRGPNSTMVVYMDPLGCSLSCISFCVNGLFYVMGSQP